jgi:CHAD domain-containing protein
MAKPREITGLDCDKRSLAWVSKILLTRFDEMAEFRHAALGFAEIKGVHDMRVATRRVRSVLRDFEPFLNKEPLREIKKELKGISDALGAVRDRDVAIGALKRWAEEAKDERVKAGIEQLAEENVAQRNIARAELTVIITAEKVDNLGRDLKAAIKEAAAGTEKTSFSDASGRMVAANLADTLDLAPRLYKPFKRNGLHKLRIAAKRLRYSVELAALCFGDDAKKLAKEISRMQTYLGELHDCDIWIEDLGKRLAGEPDENARAAAAWLLPIFVRRQNKEYLSALELWEEWRGNDLAGRIWAMAG